MPWNGVSVSYTHLSLPNYVRKTGSAATVTYPFSSYYDVSVSGIDPAAAEVTLIFDRYGENTVFLTIPLKGLSLIHI